MRRSFGVFSLLCLVPFGSAFVSLPAAAILDGSMSGVVRDASGQPLPGVRVSVKGIPLQGVRTAVTRADGTYKVPILPAGDGYSVTFALAGFRNVERTGLAVRLGEDTQVNPTLELAAVEAATVVTAEAPVVDITRTDTSQTYDAEYLRRTPVGFGARSYLYLAGQPPGVSGTGNVSALGGSGADNAFLVDGVSTTDPVVHTWGLILDLDATQEMSVSTSGYQAEYGRGSGAIVNLVTKSGGNRLSGSFDLRYSSNALSESGDHYDATLSESRTTPWSATLGGPVTKDRFWFFGNLQHFDRYTTPYTTNAAVLADNPSPSRSSYRGWRWGLKLSFTLDSRFNGFVSYSDGPQTVPLATILTRPEATTTQEQSSTLFTLKLNGVFSPSWLGELQVARYLSFLEAGPSSGDDSLSGWTNRFTGVLFDSATGRQWSDRNTTQGGLSTTYFLANAIGNHELKAGLWAQEADFPFLSLVTGTPSDPAYCPAGSVCGATFQFSGFDAAGNRVPYAQTVRTNSGELSESSTSFAAYGQDQWRPTPRLTVNAGLRWDRTRMKNNEGIEVIAFDTVQPRLSAAYDLTGDGKTVARANYGTFATEPGLALIGNSNTGVISPVSRLYLWDAKTQKWVFSRQTGGALLQVPLVDPDLAPIYDDHLSVALQREVARGVSVTGTYVYKRTNNMIEDTCWDGAACTAKVITNDPGKYWGVENPLGKDYYGYQLEVRARTARLLLNASYSYAKSRGSTDGGSSQYQGGDFNFYPQHFVNKYGYLPADERHEVKVYAAWMIPWAEADLAAEYFYGSGLPYTIVVNQPPYGAVFQEPRGSSRLPAYHYLNLQVARPFRVTGGLTVSPIVSCLNVIGAEAVTGIGAQVGSSTFGEPTSWQQPRSWQVGVRVEF